MAGPANPSNDAVRYSIPSWYLYHGDTDHAKKLMEQLVTGKTYSSFGHSVAESNLIYHFGHNAVQKNQ